MLKTGGYCSAPSLTCGDHEPLSFSIWPCSNKACSLLFSQASLLLNQAKLPMSRCSLIGVALKPLSPASICEGSSSPASIRPAGMHRPALKSSTNQSRGAALAAAIPIADTAIIYATTRINETGFPLFHDIRKTRSPAAVGGESTATCSTERRRDHALGKLPNRGTARR